MIMRVKRKNYNLNDGIVVHELEMDRRDVVVDILSQHGFILCGRRDFAVTCQLPYQMYDSIEDLYEKYPLETYRYIPLSFSSPTSAYSNMIGRLYIDKTLNVEFSSMV